MFKRLHDWLFPPIDIVVDEGYPDIQTDDYLAFLLDRYDDEALIDDEDNVANFWMEQEELD